MKKIVFVLTTGILLSACSSEQEKVNTETIEAKTTDVVVNPNQLLTMEIDGMVCQMGCGGAIRKGLKDTKGVASVEFDFEEERKTNVAKIAYDKSIVSSEELITTLYGEQNNTLTGCWGICGYESIYLPLEEDERCVPGTETFEELCHFGNLNVKYEYS